MIDPAAQVTVTSTRATADWGFGGWPLVGDFGVDHGVGVGVRVADASLRLGVVFVAGLLLVAACARLAARSSRSARQTTPAGRSLSAARPRCS